MVIIICDSWEDAEECYDIFLTFVEDFCPSYSVVSLNDCVLRVKMDDDITYMFSDYHYAPLFEKDPENDIFTPDEFFEGIPYFYDYVEGVGRRNYIFRNGMMCTMS